MRIDKPMTIYTAAELKPMLLAAIAQAAEIEIDLSSVDEIDSAGLQLLILVKREAAARGKALRLAAHHPAVIDVLDLCNLHAVFGDPVVIPSASAKARGKKAKRQGDGK